MNEGRTIERPRDDAAYRAGCTRCGELRDRLGTLQEQAKALRSSAQVNEASAAKVLLKDPSAKLTVKPTQAAELEKNGSLRSVVEKAIALQDAQNQQLLAAADERISQSIDSDFLRCVKIFHRAVADVFEAQRAIRSHLKDRQESQVSDRGGPVSRVLGILANPQFKNFLCFPPLDRIESVAGQFFKWQKEVVPQLDADIERLEKKFNADGASAKPKAKDATDGRKQLQEA